jgi:hypothetical protein
MGARSAVNKKKQTMLYPWLLPMNIVDTIFDVRGLCDDGFRRQGREGARAWQCSSVLRRSVGLASFSLSSLAASSSLPFSSFSPFLLRGDGLFI